MLAAGLQDEGPADTLWHHVIYGVIGTPPGGLRGERSCGLEPLGLGRLMMHWEPIKTHIGMICPFRLLNLSWHRPWKDVTSLKRSKSGCANQWPSIWVTPCKDLAKGSRGQKRSILTLSPGYHRDTGKRRISCWKGLYRGRSWRSLERSSDSFKVT